MPDTVIAARYRLVELLGHGGMSEVWRAEDLELGRSVAIKLLAPDADTARFEREARAVAALGHPNVVQVYDYGESDGRPYMVLEYVPSGTLESRLRAGKPVPDDEAFAIAAGIAAGLAHAHARGVVHRDMKPANVLFDADDRPKIADFGIARMAVGEGTLTEAGTVLGTAAYISPEQAMGGSATSASDVYSWGVIVYRMLTGRLPFEANDPLELVTMHRDVTPPPISLVRDDAPAVLESTATAALEKDPADRPHDGAALLAELGVPATAGALSAPTMVMARDDATRVLPGGAGAQPGGPAPPPSRRVPLIVAAVVLLAVAGGALAYELTRSSASPAETQTAPTITFPTRSTTAAEPTTTAAAPTTTEATATEATTTEATTQAPTTTAAPPPTTIPPPTTTEALPTTEPLPTTTAPPPTDTTGTITIP